MRKFFSFLCAATLLFAATSCQDTPEPEPEPIPEAALSDITAVEVTATTVSLEVSVCNADVVSWCIVSEATFNEYAGEWDQLMAAYEDIHSQDVERSESDLKITYGAENLTPETKYVTFVWADNKDVEIVPVDVLKSLEFTTLAAEEPEPEPAGPVVEMSDIQIVDLIGNSVDFAVTTRYMNDFGFVLFTAEEYSEPTVEYVLANSLQYAWDDGNSSWEEEFAFAFTSDTKDETDYVVVAVAVNDTSSVMKTLAFTTPKEELVVNQVSFNPTSLKVVSQGNDHYLTLSTSLKELRIHLVSEGFGGRYEPTSPTHYFVAEGSYWKEMNNDGEWVENNELDDTFGNIDLYENVITGKWEVYASFFFLPSTSIQIEIPSGTTLTGAERDEPVEFNLNIKNAKAEKDASKGSVWHLTLEQDADNTLTFDLKLDSSKYEYIPSGEYLYDGQGAPCLDGCSMIVNNVSTSLGKQSVGLSKVVVNYNEATKETYVSAVAYVKSGTAVVKINNAGPFNLYEEKEQGLEECTESRNLMIWSLWDGSTSAWELNFSGDAFYGFLYFVTGTDSSAYLPEGRYVFAKSAPADGSLWIDCNRSYVTKLRTTEKMTLDCTAQDAYLDVTTTNENGQYIHTIKGVLRTENGFYKINFDYGADRGSIY